MKKVGLSLIIAIFPLFIFGQIDTMLSIDEVEILGRDLRNNQVGSQTQQYNAQTLATLPARNIAELLQQESSIFIKTYSSGSLATSSMRGGNAGHTLVLWNNLPIQSPMLGLLDLSLLPSNMAETVTVQQGGGTTMWGSGAVGGVISLQNKANFDNKISANTQVTFGSFGLFQQNVSAKIGTPKFQSHTKISYQQAENDFIAQLAPTIERQQTNAAFNQRNILQDFYFKPNSKHTFATHFWYQQSNRQIPPTSVQTRSEAHQNDKAFRLIMDWNYVNKSVWNGKVGFFKEYLNYFDEQIVLVSLSDFSTVLGELDTKIYTNYGRFHFGTTHTFTEAKANGYANTPTEYRAALFATHHWNYKNWQTQLSIRQEIVNGQIIPITPMLGIEKALGKMVDFKLKVSKNYRLPTLNDRFWQPGGNADLLPESGWSEEATLAFKRTSNHWKYNVSATAFNRNIDNWIMWALLENQQFWSANNITEVWSRGLENRLGVHYKKGHWKYDFSTGYNWIRSTNQIAITKPKIPADQQLFYTPEHQVFGKLGVRWQQLHAHYYHSFTSATLGVNENLEAYDLGDFRLRYDWKFHGLKGHLLFNIQNIWNTNYYIVERRPMSGRNFSVSFIVQ